MPTTILATNAPDWPLDLATSTPINIAKFLRRVRAGLIIVPAILVFLAHGFFISLFTRDPLKRRGRLALNVSRYSRFALRHLRIQVSAIGSAPSNENYLIVSNHLSYIDLMVLSSLRPSVFVTSIDMGDVFFLGTMAEIGGSLFIERRNRDRIDHDVEQIACSLRAGQDVVLFPEGTSGNGRTVLPFRKSLLMAAPAADRALLPISLRYNVIDGKPFGRSNHHRVCWYGKMGFFPHFLELLTFRKVEASVEFHLPIRPREGDTKDTLAKWTYRTIRQGYERGGHPLTET